MENKNYKEMENNIIELVDEEGKSQNFEHVATVEHEGNIYIMVVDEETMKQADVKEDVDVDAIVLKIEKDENDEDIYVGVEDEELAQVVFEKCLQAIEEEMENED